MTATDDPQLFDDAFWRDPYPALARLRAEEPVRPVTTPSGPIWLVTRYDDVRAALADPRLSKDWRFTLPPEERQRWAIKLKPIEEEWLKNMEAKGLPGRQLLSDLREAVKRYDP